MTQQHNTTEQSDAFWKEHCTFYDDNPNWVRFPGGTCITSSEEIVLGNMHELLKSGDLGFEALSSPAGVVVYARHENVVIYNWSAAHSSVPTMESDYTSVLQELLKELFKKKQINGKTRISELIQDHTKFEWDPTFRLATEFIRSRSRQAKFIMDAEARIANDLQQDPFDVHGAVETAHDDDFF